MNQSYPEPPYSEELLADFHAGALPDDVTAHLRRRIADDPSALRVLAALDRTTDALHARPLEPVRVPEDVDAKITSTLAAIRAESVPAASHAAAHTSAEPVVDLAQRRRRRSPSRARIAAIVVGTAAAVALLVGVVTAALTTTDNAPDRGVLAQRSSASTATSGLDGVEKAAALSVLGKRAHAPFGSDAALRRCTAANGVPASTPVLGSGEITVGGSTQAVILLGTGVAGRFDALVVDRDCDTGNPATVSRTRLGG